MKTNTDHMGCVAVVFKKDTRTIVEILGTQLAVPFGPRTLASIKNELPDHLDVELVAPSASIKLNGVLAKSTPVDADPAVEGQFTSVAFTNNSMSVDIVGDFHPKDKPLEMVVVPYSDHLRVHFSELNKDCCMVAVKTGATDINIHFTTPVEFTPIVKSSNTQAEYDVAIYARKTRHVIRFVGKNLPLLRQGASMNNAVTRMEQAMFSGIPDDQDVMIVKASDFIVGSTIPENYNANKDERLEKAGIRLTRTVALLLKMRSYAGHRSHCHCHEDEDDTCTCGYTKIIRAINTL